MFSSGQNVCPFLLKLLKLKFGVYWGYKQLTQNIEDMGIIIVKAVL